MHKFLAAAALCVVSFAMPVLPTQAAPMLSDAQTNCLIFPMFKKECWQLGVKHAAAVPAAVVATTKTAAVVAKDTKLPMVWKCTRAPAGAGHLLDC